MVTGLAVKQVRAIAAAAMPEEAQELRALASETEALDGFGASDRELLTFADGQRVLLVTTGIGLVNAAAGVAGALAEYSPDFIASFGSAGGFASKVQVGQVAASSSLVYSVADATAFGYAPGQVPGMPAQFAASDELLASLPASVVQGQFISGDTFVAGDLLADLTARWPEATATDMESTAIAQVAFTHEIPFVSLRGISDLCGADAAEEHSATVEQVSTAAARALIELL